MLAIQPFKNKRGKEIEIFNVTMSERAENLKEFLLDIKKDELNLKAIFHDESKYKANLFWSNNISKTLLHEYRNVFPKKNWEQLQI